jgi:hypothetical protein
LNNFYIPREPILILLILLIGGLINMIRSKYKNIRRSSELKYSGRMSDYNNKIHILKKGNE